MEGYVCCANVCICFLLFRCHVGYHKREATSSIDIDIKRLKKWSPPHKRIFGRIQFSLGALFCRFFCSLSLPFSPPISRYFVWFDSLTVFFRLPIDCEPFWCDINSIDYFSITSIMFIIGVHRQEKYDSLSTFFSLSTKKKERIKDLVGQRAQKKRRLNKRKSLSS